MNTRPAVGQRVTVAHAGNPYCERRGTVAAHSDTWPTLVYLNLDPVLVNGRQIKPSEKLRGIAWAHVEPLVS